jgi:hypothetical protein
VFGDSNVRKLHILCSVECCHFEQSFPSQERHRRLYFEMGDAGMNDFFKYLLGGK